MGELLPCPVCRAKAEQHEETRRVRCSNADCMMRLGDARFTVEVWNRRASPEVSEAEVERAAKAIYEAHAAQYPRPKWCLSNWAGLDDATRRHWTAVATGSIAALTAARGERT